MVGVVQVVVQPQRNLVDEDDEGDEGGRSGGEGNNEFVNPDTSQMNGVIKHSVVDDNGSGFF